uniref:L1 transposable element RRM domain-containing protein n=1 Tax=Xiphophorus maculatus TaxID=8083 RepID=A0A3B5PZ48_XIPMA
MWAKTGEVSLYLEQFQVWFHQTINTSSFRFCQDWMFSLTEMDSGLLTQILIPHIWRKQQVVFSCRTQTKSSTARNVYSPDFKAEFLIALRAEMVDIFKTELETALTNNLTQIKSELHGVKTELSASIAAIRSEMDALRATVADMEGPLSSCTDDLVSLKSNLDRLSAQVLALDSKCEDFETRSRRNDIRIIGLPEERNPVSADTISTLLKDAFGLEKEPVVDRGHRSLQAKPKPGERPRPIMARLHYHADCADILRRARAQQRVKVGDSTISIFPDFTVQTAKARAAFNDVRRQLREVPDIRFGLLHPARLRITKGGVTRVYFTRGGDCLRENTQDEINLKVKHSEAYF